MAIIMVSCSCCSVVSYAYEINKVLYHPCHAVLCFLCTFHTGFNPVSISASPHVQSSAGLFSAARPAAPHALLHPSLYLCPSL